MMVRLYLAWLVALAGVLISLHFGEGGGVIPCPLCWYQRIALFPLALLLGIALFRGDRSIVFYTLPLAGLGLCIALYQALEPQWSWLRQAHLCGSIHPCSAGVPDLFGTVPLSWVSVCGFLLILSLLV